MSKARLIVRVLAASAWLSRDLLGHLAIMDAQGGRERWRNLCFIAP